MIKAFIFLFSLFLAIKFGIPYYLSQGFQTKADKNKYLWTCGINNVVSEFYTMFSRYKKAGALYKKTAKRCKGMENGQKAEFKVAYCLESDGLVREAIEQYTLFMEMYPKTERALLADRKIARLRLIIR